MGGAAVSEKTLCWLLAPYVMSSGEEALGSQRCPGAGLGEEPLCTSHSPNKVTLV